MDSKQTFRIGAMVERVRAYGRGICQGIAQYAQEKGNWQLTLLNGNNLDDRRLMRQFDGFICRFLDPRLARRFTRLGKPVVDVFFDRPIPGIAAVDADHVGIGRAAAEHLIDHHFTRFAFCGNNGCGYSDGRLRGFSETLAQRGFDCLLYRHPGLHYSFDMDKVFDDPIWDAGDINDLRDWVKSLPKPIAVFASHDFRAYQIIQACQQTDIAVPQQVAVIGVDDDPVLCLFSTPTITSIDPDAASIGRLAAQTLDELLVRGIARADIPPRFSPCCGIRQRASTDVFPIKPEWMADALLFIRHHVSDGISSSDVCRHVGHSHTLVSAQFNKLLRSTIQEEIMRVRLQEARRLLLAGQPPVKVASLAGFRSLTYFSTCFAKAFGMPPSTFIRTSVNR